MKSINRLIYAALLSFALTISGCQSGSGETTTSKERKVPNYLTSLPIPNTYKQAVDQKGKVEVYNYDTKMYDINGNGSSSVSKKAEVYLPYGYDGTKTYDVLYLMHGGGEDQSYWLTKEKDTVKVLDYIFAEGLADPCIIICPTFYTGKSSTGSMDSEATDVFQYELRNDLIPVIEEDYATYCQGDTSLKNLIATRDHRGFAGLSMGSMTSIRSALLGCLDIIGYISSMSGGYDANDDTGEQGFAKVEEAVKETFKNYPILFWLNQNGTDDIALTPHQKLHELVLERLDDYFIEDENYKWMIFQGGQHNFDAWLVHLFNTLQIFF